MSRLDALIEDELWMTPPTVAGREIWICLRTDGGSQEIFGDGNQDNPFDGSTQPKFDEVMIKRIPQTATIRFGPGTFETKGGGGNGHTSQGIRQSLMRCWGFEV